MRFKDLKELEALRDTYFHEYQTALRKLQEDPSAMSAVSNNFTKFKQAELDVKNYDVYKKIGDFYA